MSRSDAEWVAFSREHRVAYELGPLLETRAGEKLQSGFTLTLYAAAPMEKAAGAERQEAGRQLWDELRSLVEHAVPPGERTGRAELDPPHTALVRAELDPPRTALLRPENEFKPEVALTWRIFHPGEPSPVTAEDRERLAQFEKRLAALGLKRGRW
jgi:hypothetical protein